MRRASRVADSVSSLTELHAHLRDPGHKTHDTEHFQITFASVCSNSTSFLAASGPSPTILPAARAGGGSIFVTFSRFAGALAGTSSTFVFLAAMMPFMLAERGLFSPFWQVTAQGSLSSRRSRLPPSI